MGTPIYWHVQIPMQAYLYFCSVMHIMYIVLKTFVTAPHGSKLLVKVTKIPHHVDQPFWAASLIWVLAINFFLAST